MPGTHGHQIPSFLAWVGPQLGSQGVSELGSQIIRRCWDTAFSHQKIIANGSHGNCNLTRPRHFFVPHHPRAEEGITAPRRPPPASFRLFLYRSVQNTTQFCARRLIESSRSSSRQTFQPRQRPLRTNDTMAPLILHNVPDEELYVGDDGIKRPYAMVFPQYV